MMGSQHATRELLEYLRTGYPILLLLVFVSSFVANSILTAKNANQNSNAVHTGPGGRPLPKRSRSTVAVVKAPRKFSRTTELAFKWLSLTILVTFVADAAINIAHVMMSRGQQWWCGQSVVVCDLAAGRDDSMTRNTGAFSRSQVANSSHLRSTLLVRSSTTQSSSSHC